jgi:hypothetical protein
VIPVDLIDPDGVEILDKQEVTEIRLLVDLLCLEDIVPDHALSEALLNNKVL